MVLDYSSLKVTRERRCQAGDWLEGMCYLAGKLYTVEGWRLNSGSFRRTLAVYSLHNCDDVTLLDTLDLDGYAEEPRINRETGLVYVPCQSSGVWVIRYDGRKLVLVNKLVGVRNARSLAVASIDKLYVCDWESCAVCLLDIPNDKISARIQEPITVSGQMPYSLAVLGDAILVWYGDTKTLVLYRHGVLSTGTVVPRPKGLRSVWGLTTDYYSNFLLADDDSRTIFVVDLHGNMTHAIPVPGDKEPWDCTVVDRELWVGCLHGNILAMAAQ